MRSHFGYFSRVPDANPRRTRIRCLRNQRPEPLRQFQVWTHAAVLIRRKRRQIHSIANHSFQKIVANLQCHLRAELLLCFGRRARNMRSGDHVRKPDQRAILRRLLGKDVQSSSGDVATLDGCRQIRFVDELPASSIDDAHALLHLRNGRGVDHFPRLRTHGRV